MFASNLRRSKTVLPTATGMSDNVGHDDLPGSRLFFSVHASG